jgi:hypothetical protein
MDKLTNSVTTALDDDLYEFAKRDASLTGLDISSYIRATILEKREKKFSELRIFTELLNVQK